MVRVTKTAFICFVQNPDNCSAYGTIFHISFKQIIGHVQRWAFWGAKHQPHFIPFRNLKDTTIIVCVFSLWSRAPLLHTKRKADIKNAFVAIPGIQWVLWLPFGRVKDFQVNYEVTLVGCHVAVLLFPVVVQVGSLAKFSMFPFYNWQVSQDQGGKCMSMFLCSFTSNVHGQGLGLLTAPPAFTNSSSLNKILISKLLEERKETITVWQTGKSMIFILKHNIQK